MRFEPSGPEGPRISLRPDAFRRAMRTPVVGWALLVAGVLTGFVVGTRIGGGRTVPSEDAAHAVAGFDAEQLVLSLQAFEAGQVPSVPLVEVLT